MISIREAKSDDLEGMGTIFQQVHRLHVMAEPKYFREVSASDFKKLISDSFDDPKCLVHVAQQNVGVVGYILVTIKEKPESVFRPAMNVLSIEQLAVDNQSYRLGVGTLLINHIKQLAIDLKISNIELDFWDFNTGAKSFFESLGFSSYNHKMRLNEGR